MILGVEKLSENAFVDELFLETAKALDVLVDGPVRGVLATFGRVFIEVFGVFFEGDGYCCCYSSCAVGCPSRPTSLRLSVSAT